MIVKRSALPSRNRFNGSSAGLAHARYHKIGNLYFSKKACEVFENRTLAMVEYDEEAHRMTFTAVQKPPKGLAEQDCFPLVWHEYKGSPSSASMALKRMFTYLAREYPAQADRFDYRDAIDFPVVSVNPEMHSVVLALPPPSNHVEEQPAAGEPAVAGMER